VTGPTRRAPIVAVVALAAVIVAAAGVLLQTDIGPFHDPTQRSPSASASPSPSEVAAGGRSQVPESPRPEGTTISAQIVVYGSTPSGIVAAVSAARSGANVILVSPDLVIGGMMTSGLGHTDAGRRSLVGGLPREVLRSIDRSEARSAPDWAPSLSWDFEPHVALAVFTSLLDKAHVGVYTGVHLDRTRPVDVESRRITAIAMTDGTTIRGDEYIDASYEGDLMAAAGVPSTIGRESHAKYGEPLAGARPVPARAAPSSLVHGVDATGMPLPGTTTATLENSAGDGFVQAATYRLCVTDDRSNLMPFAQPAGYDPANFALIGRALSTWRARTGTAPTIASVLSLSRLPDHKWDLNNSGLFSTDVMDAVERWPTGDEADRAAMMVTHRDWVQGLLWYLRTAPAVPVQIRRPVARLGLCADEFAASGGWPPELYIREARRMVGDLVLTQRDLQTKVTKADPIALGTYRIDAHYVRRLLGADGRVRGDGLLSAPATPYQIPYRALLPPAQSVDNLIVSVTISASHVAWSSIRTEPTLMAIGQAAGVAAAIAAHDGVATHDVDVRAIRKVLLAAGAIIAAPVRH